MSISEIDELIKKYPLEDDDMLKLNRLIYSSELSDEEELIAYVSSLPIELKEIISSTFEEYKRKVDQVTNCDIVELNNIYNPSALEDFSVKNLFFGERVEYEKYHTLFRNYYSTVSTRGATDLTTFLYGSGKDDFTEAYFQKLINAKATANRVTTTERSIEFFREVNKSVEVFILGHITNKIRPYIYKCIKILNKEMGGYGRFIISGGEAFNFNVKKEYRAITPDIDTKFVPYYDDIKNASHMVIGLNHTDSYTDFLYSMEKMWYTAMEKVLNYLNSNYTKIYSLIQELEQMPEFRMLKVVFVKPSAKVAIFRKRFTIFDKKISDEGGVFYNLPLFTFDMALDSYLRTEKNIEIPYKKYDEEKDDEDEIEEVAEDDDDLKDEQFGVVYSRNLSKGDTIMGVLDCPFMKPNENGYDIGFKGKHVEITSTMDEKCIYRLLYASTEYLSEDINKLIELKLRKGKSEKDKYRQEVMETPAAIPDPFCGEKYTLSSCDIGSDRKVDEISTCRWDKTNACNFSPLTFGKLLSYCIPPKWIVSAGNILYQEQGIVDRDYLDKKCCEQYLDTRQRIYRCLTTSFYDYENNRWVVEPAVTEENKDKVDLYLNPEITYRFDKSYFNRYGVDKETARIIRYDSDNIVNKLVSYLSTIKQKYDRSPQLEENKTVLKNEVGRLCLFYNPYLVDHNTVSLKIVSNLVRLFTTGLVYNNRYQDSALLIDKILTYIGDDKTIFTSLPPKIGEIPPLNAIIPYSIDDIKRASINIEVYRKPDRNVPRDLYKIFIVDEPENFKKMEYIESFYPDDISPVDKDALELYVIASMDLNKKLRNGEVKYNQFEKKLYYSLLSILRQSKKNEHPITVYRGLSGENLDSIYVRQLYENGRVSDQFTSVSISPAVAYNFVKGFSCCVLKIYVIGVQMVYLEPLNITKYQYEYELLLPPGIVLYYLGSSEQTVTEGGELIGNINIVECIATQLPDELFNTYIKNFTKTHNLEFPQTKSTLRQLRKKAL